MLVPILDEGAREAKQVHSVGEAQNVMCSVDM